MSILVASPPSRDDSALSLHDALPIFLRVSTLASEAVVGFSQHHSTHATRLRLTSGGQAKLQIHLLIHTNGVEIRINKKTVSTHVSDRARRSGNTTLIDQYVQKCGNSMSVPVLHGIPPRNYVGTIDFIDHHHPKSVDLNQSINGLAAHAQKASPSAESEPQISNRSGPTQTANANFLPMFPAC